MYAKKRLFKEVDKLLLESYGFDKLTPAETAELRRAWEIGWVPLALRSPEQKKLYGSCNPPLVYLQKKLASKASVKYTTYSHTGQPVPLAAVGAGSDAFAKDCDNVDIPKKIKMVIQR